MTHEEALEVTRNLADELWAVAKAFPTGDPVGDELRRCSDRLHSTARDVAQRLRNGEPVRGTFV